MGKLQKLLMTGVVAFALALGVAVTPASSMAMDVVATVECTLFGCREGCTSGPNCHSYSKCLDPAEGDCEPTVQNKTCKELFAE